MSPSPSLRERPRALKSQSMPLVPSIANFNTPQSAQQQPSPTIPNNGMRRTPPPGQVSRLLPTPPHPNPPNFSEEQSHYPRPPLRAPIAGYPNKFQELESQMTPEFFADIDRAAEQQQAQYQSSQQVHSFPRSESPKQANPDRARVPTEGSSPSIPDSVSRARREQLAREAPQTRQNSSPIASSFVQASSHTPERRMSPAQHSPVIKTNEPHPGSYLAAYNAREASATARRASNADSRLNVTMPSFSPPLQTIATRTPDRSLPVQEEDEVLSKNGTGWKVSTETNEEPYRSPSPTSSSDIQTPDPGSNQRFDASNVYRDEEKGSKKLDESHAQFVERDSTEDDASYTPRSPATGLPEDNRDIYYPGQTIPVRVPAPVLPKGKARNGPSDHVMRGLETTLLEQQPPQQQQQQQQVPQQASAAQAPPQQSQNTERSTQNIDQHKQPEQDHHQYQDYPPESFYGVGSIPSNARYIPAPQVYPDDFQGYTDDYLHYLNSPRPDAPVPPTPHSQSTAPSPSPLLHVYNNGGTYRPARAAGSPYPYPYDHVLRNRHIPPSQRFFPNGIDQSTITDKVARQWQIYAQNNHGAVTDSTLSPSATPFRPNTDSRYDEWAILHTTRMMRQNTLAMLPRVGDRDGATSALGDNASIRSSPSHQPIVLPVPPSFTMRKKDRDRAMHARRQAYARKPPPRVESTQPRETSPELSSSGEETAGEDRYSVVAPQLGITINKDNVVNDPLPFPVSAMTPPVNDEDDAGEWIDEDDDDDYEDLIDLEYHPTFVKNITKRRRKWEVGWENLIQAFQALDRQTDATMILLASPSHTTKLHALKSRSIRRHPNLANSTSIKDIRAGFARVAAQRRLTRPDKSSLVDRLLHSASSSSGTGDGSDGSSSGSVEENLKRALDAALGSLSAMGEVYEQREARVMEELRRSREDRERVELLLRQVLGDKHPFNAGEKQQTTAMMK
ncbi:hypothetical protein JR316_0005359 [Psilocybe cubensis]|nr:hypothetical protein JR316_0005359 [Psilocybe cubensis]KAH9483255.1 hypothetical protein JR316_0005359 [Psilocybe cubensis]